jgi:hypothetical protein
MSHFYARIPTSARRTVATARGHKSTGIAAEVLTFDGGVRVSIRHAGGGDLVWVERIPHPQSGRGASEVIAVFPVTCPSKAEFAAATAKAKPAPVTFTPYPVAATCPATGAEYGTAE